MFELTNSLSYVVPIMLAVLVGKTVADAIEPKGIYDLVIAWVRLEVSSSDWLIVFSQARRTTISRPQTRAPLGGVPNYRRRMSEYLQPLVDFRILMVYVASRPTIQ